MKTKNFYGWLTMAAMLVGTGCSTDEVVNDYSPKNAIQFGTYVGRDAESRGSVITTGGSQVDATNGTIATDALSEKGFGVFAYYTQGDFVNTATPNFMYNQKVAGKATTTGEGNNTTTTYSTDSWEYSPLKYWPNNSNDKISFFAYAPWDANEAEDNDANTTETNNIYLNLPVNTAQGIPSVSYLVSTDVTEQIDLLYANVKNASKQTINNNVSFNFNHALSRIGFKVQALVDYVNDQATQTTPDNNTNKGDAIASGTTITVNKIVIKFGSSYKDNGSLNLETGVWTKGTTNNNTTNSYTLQSVNFEEINISNEPQKLNKDNSYLMILPHSFDALKDEHSDNTDRMSIEVTYTVETTDTNLAGGKSTVENTINSGDFTWTFEQGKAYNFVLHLGMTSVKLTANIVDWDTKTNNQENDIVVNVPINTGTNPATPANP